MSATIICNAIVIGMSLVMAVCGGIMLYAMKCNEVTRENIGIRF